MASVGAVSNPDHANTVIGKAGRARWQGKRPQTRGIEMNPIDHPNGGRTNGGRIIQDAVGQDREGCSHPQEQVDGQVHRTQPS